MGMTVQELIDELMKVKDKSKEVVYEDVRNYETFFTLSITSVDEYDKVVEISNF